MTDKELIQLYKMCNELETCEGCPGRSDFDLCPIDRYCDLDELIPRLEALLAENEHLREATKMVPQWASAKERLPEENRCVIARDMVGVVTTAYYNGSWHGMLNCDAVTHWIPLPEPPSTEGVE